MDVKAKKKKKKEKRERAKSESEQERAGGEEGGREGVFRIVIGAVEVISDLKSSRCGPAPEKGREAERNQEGGRSINQTLPFRMISSLHSLF